MRVSAQQLGFFDPPPPPEVAVPCRVPSPAEQVAFAEEFPEHVAPMPAEYEPGTLAAAYEQESATSRKPIDVWCPQCQSQPGNNCRNYKGRGCAPHRQRVTAVR